VAEEEIMPAISNDEIAILCAIGEGGRIAARQEPEVDALIAEGLVERTHKAALEKYQLTGKGQQFLAERGAGLNES
jgi:hypothetical protein